VEKFLNFKDGRAANEREKKWQPPCRCQSQLGEKNEVQSEMEPEIQEMGKSKYSRTMIIEEIKLVGEIHGEIYRSSPGQSHSWFSGIGVSKATKRSSLQKV
jgi:hypothetical protein